MNKCAVTARWSLVVLLTLACSLAWAAKGETGQADSVALCRQDLAKRLQVKDAEVKLVDAQAVIWSDGALGMPEPDTMYTQARVPGWRIVLEARKVRYLYTASDRVCRFGGPLALWEQSMLYLRAVPDDPNLNGELYQCALSGTNHRRLLTGVSDYAPQADGVILFTRRTSRSSFELHLACVEKKTTTKKLYGAFFIGTAALNAAQDTWAAVVRQQVGAGWSLAVKRMDADKVIALPLPDGIVPRQLLWSEGQVMLQATKADRLVFFVVTPTEVRPAWAPLDPVRYQAAQGYMLNKSEWLEVTQTGTKERPAVEVARVWFTGDRKVLATIRNLTLEDDQLIGGGYVFLWGTQQGQSAAFTVNITTGEVTTGYRGPGVDFRPFVFPPLDRP
jgi:hypothetical protein